MDLRTCGDFNTAFSGVADGEWQSNCGRKMGVCHQVEGSAAPETSDALVSS